MHNLDESLNQKIIDTGEKFFLESNQFDLNSDSFESNTNYFNDTEEINTLFDNNSTMITDINLNDKEVNMLEIKNEVYYDTKPFREVFMIPIEHIVRIEDNDREDKVQ